jgi:hypothetical protein
MALTFGFNNDDYSIYYGAKPPEDSGWAVSGMETVYQEGPLGGDGGYGLIPSQTLAWRRAAAAQEAQGGQDGSSLPDANATSQAQAQAQAQLDASLVANQQAIEQARSSYAQQGNDMASTVSSLQSLLLKSKEDAAKSLADQKSSFDSYMLKSSSQMDAMRSSYESQLRQATATLPDPERTAVAPRLGDFRTGGRNAAANSLSQLRIIAPSLLGNGQGSVTLGGL